MKIAEKMNPVKEKACALGKEAAVKIKDTMENHSETIMWTVLYGGLAIYYGQLIRYMHLLNKDASRGVFRWTPLSK